MAWQDSDQIDNTEWTAADDFFAADKGAEIYSGTHIFVRTEDGQIYGINQQDTQKIQANLNQKKQWPKTVEAKNKENQIVNLELVSTLFKSQYKPVTIVDSSASTGGWRDKFNSIKQMAEQTVDKASAQMSKASAEIGKVTSQISEEAGKSGWKDKLSGLKDKAGSMGLKEKLSGLKAKAEEGFEKAGCTTK